MPLQFTAIEVSIETCHDVEIITFAAPPDDDQDLYVMFQRLQINDQTHSIATPSQTLQPSINPPKIPPEIPLNSSLDSGLKAEDNLPVIGETYIEICSQTFAWFGHLKRLKLSEIKTFVQTPKPDSQAQAQAQDKPQAQASPTHLQLYLEMDETAAAQMENDGIVLINFSLTDPSLQQLRATLTDFFPIFEDQLF